MHKTIKEKFYWTFLFLIGFSFATTAQPDLQWIKNQAESLSIPNSKEAIRVCDSVLLKNELTPRDRGTFYRIKGKAYYFQGNYNQAGINYDQSVKLLSAPSSEKELGITLIEQAKLYRKIKMFPQAIETYQKARSIFERLNDNNNLATVLNEWGVVYEMMENYPKAIDFYNQSLHLKETLKDTMGIAYSNSFLSNIYVLANNLSSAEPYAQKALYLFQQINDTFRIATQSTDMSLLYEKKKDYATAVRFLKYSNEIAGKMKNRDLLSQNYLRLAEVFTKIPDYKTAYQNYRRYSELKDSLFTTSSQKTIADLNIQYQTAEKDKQILAQQNRLSNQRWLLAVAALLLCVAAIVAILIQRNKKLREAQLVSEAKHKEEILQAEAQNNLHRDRLRISRDLHDNIGAYLTFINSSLNSTDPEIKLLKETTKESIAELRRTVWLINKPAVGLEEWIVKLREYHSKAKNVIIKSTLQNPDITLTAGQATDLFRIIQESVNNAIKYADAKNIEIRIVQNETIIKVEIFDNGKGFEMASVQKGFGLENIAERARNLGGQCAITSFRGKGTLIKVEMPFDGMA